MALYETFLLQKMFGQRASRLILRLLTVYIAIYTIHLLSTPAMVDTALVFKYTKKPPSGKHFPGKEYYRTDICKYGDLDLTLFNKYHFLCVEECRARTLCKSINVLPRYGICRLNFEDDLPVSNCPNYIFSNRTFWKEKDKVGCESLNCSITQKCVEADGKHVCNHTECRNILPGVMQNRGFMRGNHVKIGDKRAFKCHLGYQMNGSQTITCQANGTWSDSVPTCIGQSTTTEVFPTTSEKPSTATKTTTKTTTITESTHLSTSQSPRTTNGSVLSTAESPSTTNGNDWSTSPSLSTTSTIPSSSQSQSTTSAIKSSSPNDDTKNGNRTLSTPDYADYSANNSQMESYYGVDCTDNVTCGTGGFMECRDQKCRCILGRVYNPTRQFCVETCTPAVYGDTYQIHHDTMIVMPSSYSETTLVSELCEEKCTENTSCSAMSIDTVGKTRGDFEFKCDFYETVQFNAFTRVSGVDFYQRDCAGSNEHGTAGASTMATSSCDFGSVYSYSSRKCMKACNQNQSTYEKFDQSYVHATLSQDLSLNYSRVYYSLDSCLKSCTIIASCNIVLTLLHGGVYKCNLYNLVPLPPTKLYDPMQDIYVRQCS